MTLKERDAYEEELVTDRFGRRTFFYYDEPTVRHLTEEQFAVAFVKHELIKHTRWLYLGLRKG